MRQQKHRDHWRHYQPPGNNNTNYPPQPSTAAPSIPFLPFDFFGFRDLTSDQIQLPPPNPLHSLPFLFPLPTAAPQPIPQPAPQPTAAAPPPPPPPQAEREYIVISDDEENSEPNPPAPPTTAPNPVMDGSTLETAITIDDNDDDEQVNSGVERPVRSLSTGTRESGSISPVKAENVSEFQDIHQRDGIQIDFDDASSEGTESSSECLFGIAPIMTEEERVMMNTSYEPPPAQASWTLLAGLSLEEKPLAMVKMEQDEADLEQQQLQQQPEIMPASAVKTKIPDDIQLSELLSRIEVYDESVRTLIAEGGPISDPAQPKKLTTRARRRRSPADEEKKATQIRCRPYVPGALWRDSTWEDWAEFQIGDWLHWPFQEWEQRVIQEVMDEYGLKARKRKVDGEFVIAEELWAVASNRLPGRRDIDCFRYWQDREVNFKDPYTKPIIISQEIRKKQVATKYEVICRSRLYGRPNPVAVKMAVWSDLRRERIFGGGSADTLAVQLVKMDDESFNVFASSACNSQLEYNMPGNLRVWSSNTDTVTQMEGHKIQVGSAEEGYQDLWTTVTDIKASHDKRFIYSASHDKSARVWCARKFNLLATLSIRPNTRENIVASGSQDGTAVIWRLHESGNYGDGVVCEINLDRYPEPNIECLAFGTGPSAQCLFTGVATNERQQMGFIQTFDADTSQEIISFSSMRGAVCDIDISTSGRYIVSGNHSPYDDDVGDGFVHINDIRSPETVIKAKTGHKDVNFVRMSPCERYVASGNPFNEVAVLDIRRPDRHLFVLRHDESIADHLVPINSDMGIAGMHWMSDNPLLITAGGDSSVKLWDTQTGNLVKTYPTSSNVTSLHVDEESLTICAGVAGAQGFVHIFSP